MKCNSIVVLGAGPAGLTAALTLGRDALVVERDERVGGCCRSILANGFTFDNAVPAMVSDDPYVRQLYTLLLGNNVCWHERGVPWNGRSPFAYPLRGGFQALMDAFLPHLTAELHLETEAVRISPSRRAVRLSDGSAVAFDALISTIPLPRLVRLLGPEAPGEVWDAAAGLRHLSVRCVSLGVGRRIVTEKLWIDFPEKTIFRRIFVQGNASPHCSPPGGFGLTCEIDYSKERPLPAEGGELIERCVEDLREVGLIAEADPIWTARETDLPFAYFLCDRERSELNDHIRAWLLERDIFVAGGPGEPEKLSVHAFVAGRNAALAVRERFAERLPS